MIFSCWAFSLDSLNPYEETQHDLSEVLFAVLEKRKAMHSYLRSRPTGEKGEYGELLEEYRVHHLTRSQVMYHLRITGKYGTDINPEPIFALDYRFQVILRGFDTSEG